MKQVASIIKQRRLANGFSLRTLAGLSGISPSHLGRIERGERFPSASVLRKFAKPLGFEEGELFVLAGFLSPVIRTEIRPKSNESGLDPYVAKVLAREPVRIQRAVITILELLKAIAGESQSRAG